MHVRRVSLFVLCLALAAPLCPPRPCAADEEQTLVAAKARYEQGERNFAAGKFAEAGADFEAAYKLSPRSDLLFDAGRAYDRAGDAARAISLYERYLLSGEGLSEEAQVRQRVEVLNQKVAQVQIRCNKDGARVTIDGQDRGTTPLAGPVPLSSGPHRIEVRLGDLVYRTDQEFVSGLTHTVTAELVAPPPPEEEEKHNRRFAAVLGLNGVIDIKSNNFPPSQAALLFGLEYRVYEGHTVAVDVTARLPLEVGQGWTNFSILPGVRLVLTLSHRVPLELVPALNLGLGILHRSGQDAPPIQYSKVLLCGGTPDCTLPGLRLHPSLSFVYHFLPNWEARAELFGLDADITSPIADPRVSFGISAAWRFY